MFYLVLAMICSSSIALIFKYSESSGRNRYAVTSANYFTASIVCLYMVIKGGLFSSFSKSIILFRNEFYNVIFKNICSFSNNASALWALISGMVAGIFFFSSFIYYQRSVAENGVGLTGSFSKMGILVPVVLSIGLWHEYPSLIQWTGILLCFGAILIATLSIDSNNENKFKFSLLVLFLLNGFAEFSNKFFSKYALIEYKDLFLFFVFSTALLISLCFTLKRKIRVSKEDILMGILVGIPNLFSSFFLILSLNTLKASVAFPLFSAGSILLINLGGTFIYKEEITTRGKISILLTILALTLINL